MRLGWVIGAACAAPLGAAEAGGWAQPEGSWFAEATASSGEINGTGAQRYGLYAEHGLSPLWTLTAQAQHARSDAGARFTEDAYRLTARRQLWRAGGFSAAAEFGAVQGSATLGLPGCSGAGWEAGGGAGWSGELPALRRGEDGERGSQRAWASLSTAYQRLGGGCERTKIDAAFARQLSGPLWTTASVWHEEGARSVTSTKLTSGFLWRGGLADVSLGYRQEVGGRFEEQMIVFGLTRRVGF